MNARRKVPGTSKVPGTWWAAYVPGAWWAAYVPGAWWASCVPGAWWHFASAGWLALANR